MEMDSEKRVTQNTSLFLRKTILKHKLKSKKILSSINKKFFINIR